MRSVFEQRVAEASKIERMLVQGDARLCNSTFGRVCKAVWPIKTAEHLALAVGCAVRTAAYEISGEHEPPAYVLAIVMGEIMRRLAGQ